MRTDYTSYEYLEELFLDDSAEEAEQTKIFGQYFLVFVGFSCYLFQLNSQRFEIVHCRVLILSTSS